MSLTFHVLGETIRVRIDCTLLLSGKDKRFITVVCLQHCCFEETFNRQVGSPHPSHYPGMSPKFSSKC